MGDLLVLESASLVNMLIAKRKKRSTYLKRSVHEDLAHFTFEVANLEGLAFTWLGVRVAIVYEEITSGYIARAHNEYDAPANLEVSQSPAVRTFRPLKNSWPKVGENWRGAVLRSI